MPLCVVCFVVVAVVTSILVVVDGGDIVADVVVVVVADVVVGVSVVVGGSGSKSVNSAVSAVSTVRSVKKQHCSTDILSASISCVRMATTRSESSGVTTSRQGSKSGLVNHIYRTMN